MITEGGKLRTTVTYLEMRQRPHLPDLAPPCEDIAIVQALQPAVSFYRYIYNTVGEPWLWGDRRKLTDDQLRAIIQDPAVEIHVLYVRGEPSGYAELDRRQWPDTELAYFGIIPECIGRRLGPYLLRYAIERAWLHSPRRLWVHTCTLDHPKALATYQRAGFTIYDTREEIEDDPRALGLM